MCQVNIDELPQKIKEDKMSIEEGVNIVWGEVYTHPYKYGLYYFSEDQKSDFLLEIRPKFSKLFFDFEPGRFTFTQFLFVKISNYKMPFLRTQMDNETKRKTIDSILMAKTEEDYHKYAESFAPFLDEYENTERCEEKLIKISDVINKPEEKCGDRHRKIAELTTLILTLKACRDVDDDTVCAVSDFTDVGMESLYEEIFNMKKAMTRREDNSLKIVTKRNNAYYFHRKYLQEMLAPATIEVKKEQLRTKYDTRTRRWGEINQELLERKNCPSNADVAKVIGIKPRMVSFYINKARNEKGLSEIQKILQEKMNQKNEGRSE